MTWLAYLQFSLSKTTSKQLKTLSVPATLAGSSAAYVAISYRWNAAFTVTYAIEFLCLSTAELLVLGFVVPRRRMLSEGENGLLRQGLCWEVVVVGDMVGVG